jgi:FMN phosphatase YigB (HAD superfamily)
MFNQPGKETQQTEKEILDKLMKDTVYQKYATGKMSAQDFYKAFCKAANLKVEFEQFKHLWNDVFMPMHGINEIVTELAAKYPLGLLSDIGPLHWEYVQDKIKVLKYFKNPVLSYRIGYLKPAKETFLLAADSVGFQPNQCLFIDDRDVNVKGAIATGMQAIRFTSAEQLRQDLHQMHIL